MKKKVVMKNILSLSSKIAIKSVEMYKPYPLNEFKIGNEERRGIFATNVNAEAKCLIMFSEEKIIYTGIIAVEASI